MDKKKSVIILTIVFILLALFNSIPFQVLAEDEGCCYLEDSHDCYTDVTYSDCTNSEELGGLEGVFDVDCSSQECSVGCCVYQNLDVLYCQDTSSGSIPSEYFCRTTYETNGVNFFKNLDVSECNAICNENSILYGYVKDSNGNTLSDVEISLSSEVDFYEITSQTSGYYFFDDLIGNIPTGTYTLVASKTGYGDFETVVSVNGPTEKEIILDSQSEEESTANVYGYVYTKESETTSPKIAIENAIAIIPVSSSSAEIKSSPSTNEGRFDLSNVPLGNIDVVVSANGKEPVMKTIEITSNDQNIGDFFLPDLSQEAQDEGVICCTWGCSDISLARSDLGDGGICESKTGVYCTGVDDSVCLESANQCCEASMFCDSDPSLNPAEPNVCSKIGKFGCNGNCVDPPDCIPDSSLASNKPDVLCKCGSSSYDTNMPGYCCENSIGNYEYGITCDVVTKYEISGKVISALSNMPIQNVAVFVTLKDYNWVDIITTDVNGRFSKEYEDEGAYEIFISKQDFESFPNETFDVADLPDNSPTSIELSSKGSLLIPSLKNNVDLGTIELIPEISSCVLDDGSYSSVKMLSAKVANQGSPELKLVWTQMNCPDVLVKYEVYRKDITKDGDSAEFNLIAILSSASFSYIDYDVEWDNQYEYEVWPIYVGGILAEDNSGIEFSTGNKSCENRNPQNKNKEFCSKINIFTGEIEDKPYFRYYCDENNIQKFTIDLEPGNLKRYADCSEYDVVGDSNKMCVGPNEVGETICKEIDDCGVMRNNAVPFGLYFESNECYGNSVSDSGNVRGLRYERFCTYDRTDSVVDECVSCYPDITDCSDYKSVDACEIDNCYAGKGSRCVWVAGSNKATSNIKGLLQSQIELQYSDLGEGFCVREDKIDKEDDSYCNLCSTENAPFNANTNCNTPTCQFLGNCFSNGEGCVSCKNYAKCEDYKTIDECKGLTPGKGYTINTPSGLSSLLNEEITDCSIPIIEYSADACGKNFCDWVPDTSSVNGGKCIKDGNDNGVSDCIDSPLKSNSCSSSNDPAKLINFEVAKSLALDGQIEFKFSKNLSTDSIHNLAGFIYCVEDANNPAYCCPSNKISPYEERSGSNTLLSTNKVFFNPENDILGFKQDSCSGVNNGVNCYDHEGVYRIRYIAVDWDFNIAQIEDELVYLDLTPPAMEVVPNYLLNDTSIAPPRSALELNIDLSEKAFCYDYLMYETGDYMSNPGDIILGNYSTDTYSEYSSMYFSTKYNNLEDGIYTYHLNCIDEVGNWNFKEWEFLVDAYKNIKIITPNFMGAIGPNDFIQNNILPDVNIKSDDPAFACELHDVRTGLDVEIGKFVPTSADLREWTITSPFTGSTDILLSNKAYDGNMYVRCMDLNLWDQHGVVEWIKQDLRFVTDYTAPETKVFGESESTDLTEFLSGDHFLVNESARISFECFDPEIDGNDRYVFGCDETEYCLTEPGSKCSPNTPISSQENNVLILDSSKNICYRSYDKGGNIETPDQENVKCISVIVDKEAPIITLNSPTLEANPYNSNQRLITSNNILDVVGEITENYDLDEIEARLFNSINLNWVNLPIAVGSSPQTYPFQKQWNLFSIGTSDTHYIIKIIAKDKAGNVAKKTFDVYFDIEGPFASNFEVEQFGVNVNDSSVEYGYPFTLRTLIDDEHWSEELTYLKIDLSCKSGQCVSQPVELLYDGTSPGQIITQKNYVFDKTPTTNEFGVYNYKAGNYLLRILAKDRFGYPLQKEFDFSIVDTNPTTISWDNSVSNVTNKNIGYQLKFHTTEPSECKFKLDIDPEFDNSGNPITDFYFPMEEDVFKQEHLYTLERTLPDNDYGFVVTCTELGGGNIVTDHFNFKIDSQVPKLVLIAKGGNRNIETQNIIQEYSFEPSVDDLELKLEIKDINEINSDNIQCKYTCYSPNSECPASLKSGYLGQWSYEKVQKQVMSFSNEFRPAGDYYFDIVCSDEAGNIAKAPELVLRIGGRSKIQILDIQPENEINSLNKNPLELSAKTNTNLECEYALNSGTNPSYNKFDTELTTGLFHKKTIADLEEGSYVYNVKCYDKLLPDDIVYSDEVFINYDLSAPTLLENELISIPEFIPVFSLHPPQSQDITGYSYELYSLPSIEIPDESIDTYSNKIFLDHVYTGTKYLKVRPVDSSGNAGTEITKEIEFDYSTSQITLTAIPGAREVDNVYYTKENSLTIYGISSFTPTTPGGLRLNIYDANNENSNSFTLTDELEFNVGVSLNPGRNDFYIFGDDNGKTAYQHIIIYKDLILPEINIYPLDLLSMSTPITVETNEVTVCSLEYMTQTGHTNTQDFSGEFTENHNLILEEPLLIDNNGIAAITVICSDGAGNIAKEHKTIRIDYDNPKIQSFDVDGHKVAENEFKIVKENLASITINADEFVRCKYDYEDKSFDTMSYYSDDYDEFLLHPRIAVRLNPDEGEDETSYDKTIYVKCQDKSTKLSDTESVLLHVRLNEPIIVFDPTPTGNINDLNPEISVKTYRDATCKATYVPEESSEGAFAFIMNFFTRLLSKSSELEKSYEGDYYYHSAKLSKSDYFQDVALNMDKSYHFNITCESDEFESGKSNVAFKINYIDSLAPIATIYILG